MQIGEANPASTTGDQATLPASFRLGDTDLAVWPDNHMAAPISASLMAIITFADWAVYHPALVEAALKAEKDPNLVVPLYRGLCGVKVRKIPEWSSPAAALIHARALMLAHRTLSRRPVYSDDIWGSIYRTGDHCMPHSHLRRPGRRQALLLRSAHRRLLSRRTGSRNAPHDASHDAGNHAHIRQRLCTQRESLLRQAAPDHIVVEHHAGAVAGAARRGLDLRYAALTAGWR